jgi:hypothetical protein
MCDRDERISAMFRRAVVEEGTLELTGADGEQVVIRPERSGLRSWYVASVLAGGGAVAAGIAEALLDTPWWLVGMILAGGLVLAVVSYWLRVWSAVTRLAPRGVLVRTWYGRTRFVPRETIAQVVHATVRTRRNRLQFALLIGDDGRCLARVSTVAVAPSSLDSFARLGAPVYGGEWGGFRQLRARFPGSAAWASAHPRLLGRLLGLLIVIVVVVAVLAASGALRG